MIGDDLLNAAAAPAYGLVHFYNETPWFKCLIDQVGHFLWGFGTSVFMDRYVPVDLLCVTSVGIFTGREQQQGKARGASLVRRFDPHADWTFFFLGLYAGAYVRYFVWK